MSASRIGQRVKRRYELLSLLGEGGQARVYRARDVRDGELVAVKVMNDRPKDQASTERMFRESRAMVTLWGTCAVRPIDEGWTEDGHFGIVMELLRGEDLDTMCRAYELSGEHVPVPWAMQIFEPVVSTLERAHEQGIVHRDLKPGNVFVLDDGAGVRLLDFGFAKFQRLARITSNGFVAGTPSYFAPETWQGLEADSRVDVFGLGALVFRTLGGRPPFKGNARELFELVVSAQRPSLRALRPELPAAIDDWVRHALASDREQRFQTVRALWNALTFVLQSPLDGGISGAEP
jgi:serine/threonine-protein kinase